MIRDRDRFVLSKGHAAPALYAVGRPLRLLRCERRRSRLRKLGSPFQGHPHVLDLPWVETSTGSLGQGFSVALGMAMGLKLQKQPRRASTRCSATASCRRAKCGKPRCARRITSSTISVAIIDYNKLQSDDRNDVHHGAGTARREMARLRLAMSPKSTATTSRRSLSTFAAAPARRANVRP